MPWSPQPGPQLEAICATWCPELLYGGAAGGGKSDFLLGDYLQDVPTYGEAWSGVLFRRTYPELEELIARSLQMFPQTGGKWAATSKTWTWPNGASLRMRYVERELDVLRYQGHQYTWIGFDELTQWPSLYVYNYLKSRLRSAFDVPTKRMRAACNPGGPGHAAVKAYFVDPAPAGLELIRDKESGLERMFIPARLEDNQILVGNDPQYRQRMKALGSTELVRALLEGDWNVVEGAFFDQWDTARHVVRPFSIPESWLRFTSLDWGYARPSAIGWYAVVEDDTPCGDLVLPRGCLVKYRELYTADKPNVGQRIEPGEVASKMLQLEDGESVRYRVADPAIFATQGGPSIAEQMYKVGINQRPADNARVGKLGALGGWAELRQRLRGEGATRPMLVMFSTCAHSIRTIPVLQHDRSKPEDLDTDAEDHAADETRYACMSRPWVPAPAATLAPSDVRMEVRNGRVHSNMSMNDRIQDFLKRKGRQNRAA